MAKRIERRGGTASVHACDLSDPDEIDRMANEVLERHGGVDILVNNAGKSIRRSVERSYDRFHDYQRTMQLNYVGPVKLILDLLPGMREQGSGHIINVSTMGLQTNTPRFAAYLASKAALDAFSRSIGPEIIGDGVHITTVYMPLVRTPMIAPTKIYDRFPTLSPEDAAHMISDAIRRRPKRVATALGNLGQLTYAVAPGAQDLVMNRAVKLFPEGPAPEKETAEQRAFVRATRGVHW
ncbi:MAG: SDR family NAD(P)-dependent oxidoreductase [Solirubrobacteraceae bacterium]